MNVVTCYNTYVYSSEEGTLTDVTMQQVCNYQLTDIALLLLASCKTSKINRLGGSRDAFVASVTHIFAFSQVCIVTRYNIHILTGYSYMQKEDKGTIFIQMMSGTAGGKALSC